MTALTQEMEGARTHSVVPLTDNAIDWHWERIWQLFREVPGFLHLYDEPYVYKQVKMGHWQVWAYSDTEIRGIMATRINIFPKCKVLDVIGVSGIAGLEFMDDMDALCETLARQNGCTYLVTTARLGMERVLTRRHDAAKFYSVLVRPVGLLRRS